MFGGQAFYVFKVNAALSELGVKPTRLEPAHRRMSQALGQRLGYTPQETAVLLTSGLDAEAAPGADGRRLDRWIDEGDVRLSIPEIGMAVRRLVSRVLGRGAGL